MSLVFPFIPTGYNVPWASFSWPLLRNGCVVPNLFHLVWDPLAVVVPFAIVAAAVLSALRPRAMLLAVLGCALWFAAGFEAERRNPSPPHLVALTEEVHFERNGIIASRFKKGHPFTERLQAVADAQKKLPPPKWP
jgi:hypothetical protein